MNFKHITTNTQKLEEFKKIIDLIEEYKVKKRMIMRWDLLKKRGI